MNFDEVDCHELTDQRSVGVESGARIDQNLTQVDRDSAPGRKRCRRADGKGQRKMEEGWFSDRFCRVEAWLSLFQFGTSARIITIVWGSGESEDLPGKLRNVAQPQCLSDFEFLPQSKTPDLDPSL